MLNDAQIAKIETVINNLNIIIGAESAIRKFDEPTHLTDLKTIDSGDLFDPGYGLCDNANLWLLDDTCERMAYSCYSIMDYLGTKFSELYGGRNATCMFPVRDVKGISRWENTSRWSYVRFCLEELTYLLDNNKVIGVE